jgi:prophage regulatory protein
MAKKVHNNTPPSKPNEIEHLLTKEQVAKRLNVSIATIKRWMANGKLPKPVRFNKRTIRWRPEDIEDFIQLVFYQKE